MAFKLPHQDPDRPASPEAALLFWALLASGQIAMRKVAGRQKLATKPTDAVINLGALK